MKERIIGKVRDKVRDEVWMDRLRWHCLAVSLLLFLLQISGSAQTIDLDDVLAGFSQSEEDSIPEDDAFSGFDDSLSYSDSIAEDAAWDQEWLDLGGDLGISTVLNFAHDEPPTGQIDHRGLSGLKSWIRLEAQIRLPCSWRGRLTGHAFHDAAYLVRGLGEFTEELLDNYEKEIELDEAWLQGSLTPSLDIKPGRQIAVWGRSDNIRVTDILNPLDLREPGLTDIEDLRLPVTMSRLDYYFGPWNLTGVVLHEIRFNKSPVLGSDFYPSDEALPPEKDAPISFNDQEYGLALNGIFRGWDLSLYGAYFFDDRAHLEPGDTHPLIQAHSRLIMAGAATNVAIGSWLLKAETAFVSGLEFNGLPDETKSRIDGLVGVEYSGFTNSVLALETVDRLLLDHDRVLENPPDETMKNTFQSSARFTRTFSHEILRVVAVASAWGLWGQEGSMARSQVEYDWTDDVSAILGIVLYSGGETSLFDAVRDNDRIFFDFKYSF